MGSFAIGKAFCVNTMRAKSARESDFPVRALEASDGPADSVDFGIRLRFTTRGAAERKAWRQVLCNEGSIHLKVGDSV
jgi:hypothetical protein